MENIQEKFIKFHFTSFILAWIFWNLMDRKSKKVQTRFWPLIRPTTIQLTTCLLLWLMRKRWNQRGYPSPGLWFWWFWIPWKKFRHTFWHLRYEILKWQWMILFLSIPYTCLWKLVFWKIILKKDLFIMISLKIWKKNLTRFETRFIRIRIEF